MRARSTRSPRLPSFAVVFLVAGAIFFSLSWWWSFPRGNGVQDPVAKLAMTVAMTTAKQEADLAETKKKVAELRQVVDRKPSSTDELEDDVVPFVFVGGIEGTGHHWYKALFEACGKTYCRPSKVGPLGWQRSAAFFASKMKSEAPARKFAAMALEKDLASAGPDLALYALNTLGGLNDAAMADIETAVGRDAVAWTQGEGMMSYPNWPAWPNKALQMPNVLAISDTLVTSRNAQLRLALTTRDADAIVNSVCLKRNFAKDAGGCATEVSMLVLGAAALTAQISALPAPPAVVCQHFAFEDLLSSDPDALQRLGRFFRLKRKILDFARKVNSKKPTSSNRAGARKLNPEWRDAFVADLARAQATMIRACEDHRLKSVISGNLNR